MLLLISYSSNYICDNQSVILIVQLMLINEQKLIPVGIPTWHCCCCMYILVIVTTVHVITISAPYLVAVTCLITIAVCIVIIARHLAAGALLIAIIAITESVIVVTTLPHV